VAKQSSQKFIARNRAPRVQIEYDVEIYGSQKKVQLPFVMGVMADLSGKPVNPLPAVQDRKFLEIDIDNFDQRLKAMTPRAAFAVPNTLTGEGNLQVDITFESMDDFSPAAIARKVEPLRKLLETRTQLSNLMTYMDGKTGAEDLVGKMLKDPTLLQTLGSAPNPAASRPAANAESESSEQPDSTTDSETKDPDDGDKGKDDLDSLLDEMK
jgi:type VI secretion system protein ImpB